jgi:hypothetical protein
MLSSFSLFVEPDLWFSFHRLRLHASPLSSINVHCASSVRHLFCRTSEWISPLQWFQCSWSQCNLFNCGIQSLLLLLQKSPKQVHLWIALKTVILDSHFLGTQNQEAIVPCQFFGQFSIYIEKSTYAITRTSKCTLPVVTSNNNFYWHVKEYCAFECERVRMCVTFLIYFIIYFGTILNVSRLLMLGPTPSLCI